MRLTTQYTEVAGQETSGNIKVVRQYASVLYLTPNTINHEASANHALGLTHVANTIWKYGVGSHDLGLTDNAVVTGDRSVNVAHDLNLSQVADRSSFGTGTTNLNLNSIVDYFNIVGDRNVAGHELGLIQEVQTLSGIHVESDLGLTDTANGVGPFKEHVSHHMFLTQTLPTPHQRIRYTESLGSCNYYKC
jgi:hypothetical protein